MLELLGVDPQLLTQDPRAVHAVSYPAALRQDLILRQTWSRICLTIPQGVPDIQWNLVFRRFLRWASARRISVFPPTSNYTDNHRIASYLMLRRRWITQYLDGLKVLRGVHWLQVTQTVEEDVLGITVNSSLHCRDLPKAETVSVLRANRWRPNLNSNLGYAIGYQDWWRWLKTSEIGFTRLGFSAAGSTRSIFWYSIRVPGRPAVPDGYSLESYVLGEIYEPIVRTLRFKTLNRISKF